MSVRQADRSRLIFGAIAAVSLSGAAGAMVAVQPVVALALLLGVSLVTLILRKPTFAALLVLVGTGLYYGIFLVVRVDVGPFPISLLDLTPLLLSVAALRISQQSQSYLSPVSLGTVALGLMGLGLIIGLVVGYLEAIGSLPMLRIARVEAVLLLVFGFCLITGRSKDWRRAVVTGLYLAAGLAVIQSLVAFAAVQLTGQSPFAFLGTGATNTVEEALGSAGLGTARDNFLPIFVMLPALALCLIRLSKVDMVLGAAILVASAVSLSRGMWIATAITVAVVALVHVSSRQNAVGKLRFAGFAAVACGVVVLLVGALIGARLNETLQPATDTSQLYRRSETGALFDAITKSPVTTLAGAGAGTIIEAPLRLRAGIRDSSPIAENQFLAKWLNFGLASVIGVSLALLGAAAAGLTCLRTRDQRQQDDKEVDRIDNALAAMSMSLPAILIVGFFAGTLLQLPVTIPMFVLAGTILAMPSNRART